ncbi:hypothetical protein GlitD10_1306 [Gloeomargarita lithophora Alchichica-D10]|uniref:Uncharacterized protein n=1 Tax=Gloeomargarita lithophora Alchichica-D10 TaxID=1188229 RepID=A0A1J0ACI1_9CYAN|nr:hypothetical protein [Gloeomargarita lithophora]APB33627.1 hypothetical protein GlitD10_1306 [Gloeomargarita lithophora Alchichica-D10]
MKLSYEQCDLYSSPMIDAVRWRNRGALEEELHRLIQCCVQANLPIGSTILKVVQSNREYCSVCIPEAVAWLDAVLDEIFEPSVPTARPSALRSWPELSYCETA